MGYQKIGYPEERPVVVQNSFGIFQGTFSASRYAVLNEIEEDEAFDHFCAAMEARGGAMGCEDGRKPFMAIQDVDVETLFVGVEVEAEGSGEEDDDEEEEEEEEEEEDEDEDEEDEEE